MDRQIIEFRAQDEYLERMTPLNTYASNIVQYIEAHFTFEDDAWAGYDNIFAIWHTDFKTKESEIIDGVTIIPAEVLNRSGVLQVNLCANKSEKGILVARMTSRPANVLKLRKAKI